jgi:hypothetical protein
MTILTNTETFRSVQDTTPGSGYPPFNAYDGSFTVYPAKGVGCALVDAIESPPNVGQESIIQAISFSWYMAQGNNGYSDPFAGPWAQFGKLYGGLVKGSVQTPGFVSPFGAQVPWVPLASSPLPPGSTLITKLWDAAEDDPPAFISPGDIPMIAQSYSFQLPQAVEYDSAVPLGIGLWFTPGVFGPGVYCTVLGATYSIAYVRKADL